MCTGEYSLSLIYKSVEKVSFHSQQPKHRAITSLPNAALSNIFPDSGPLIAILFVGGYLLRRALLPKPIPGVPYRKANAEKVFGNGLEMLAWKKKHGEMFGYLAEMALQLNAPIFQIFVHPLGKPWVVIADVHEANDIMARRTSRDFDRSRFLGDLLSSLSPSSTSICPQEKGGKRIESLSPIPCLLPS